MVTNNSIEHQAAVLGVTQSQVRAGLLKNAKAIRSYSERDLKRWGKTRKQANAIADDYQSRSQRRNLELNKPSK